MLQENWSSMVHIKYAFGCVHCVQLVALDGLISYSKQPYYHLGVFGHPIRLWDLFILFKWQHFECLCFILKNSLTQMHVIYTCLFNILWVSNSPKCSLRPIAVRVTVKYLVLVWKCMMFLSPLYWKVVYYKAIVCGFDWTKFSWLCQYFIA
jgi:phosphatidylserine synthase